MRRAALIAIALAGLATAAPAAPAATLTLDHGCYLAKQRVLPNGQAVVATARGFIPGAQVTFSLPTGPVASAKTDAPGTAVAQFSAPALRGGQFAAARTLTVTDSVNRVSQVLNFRVIAASFLPATTSNAAKQRVRFYVFGFGPLFIALKRSTVESIYMHVFQPGGRLRGSFFVGHSRGPCGDLVTGLRKILPFGLKNGTWNYRFSATRRYNAKATVQASVGFRVQTVFRPALRVRSQPPE
jgi:hypothetical protein